MGSSLKISSQKAFFKVLAFCLTFLFAPAKLRMILSWKEAPPSTLHHYSSSTSLLNWSSTKSLKISSSPFPQASQQALPPRLSPSLKTQPKCKSASFAMCLREAPPQKKPCIFGHCPNCNLTPPVAQIRALCGTTILPKMRKFFKQQF